MYLSHLSVSHLKLMANLQMSFARSDGSPRMWTTFLGENGCCKSTLLQAIALAATGPEQGNVLAGDVRPSLRDKRGDADGEVTALFTFSREFHDQREYPGLPQGPAPPALLSTIQLPRGASVVRGGSSLGKRRTAADGVSAFFDRDQLVDQFDPLRDIRAAGKSHWFCAGYGVSRALVVPQSTIADVREPVVDRLRSLFDSGHALIGTDFISRFEGEEAREFALRLREALIDRAILPGIHTVDLRGRGGVSKTESLVEAHRFDQRLADGSLLRLPATWLSHGYQSTIAWVADLIGQILLEANTTSVPLGDMEGIVLIDEIDIHLHPRWQRQIISSLRNAFPRLQFICTTHSPMVLPALSAEEVFVLRQSEQGDVQVIPAAASPTLMTGSELYDSFFDVASTKTRELRDKIDEYGALVFQRDRSPEDDVRLNVLRAELQAAGVELPWETDADPSRSGGS